ncbi:MAG: hypothetical protein Ct9H90mP7_4660 [Candidatus Neomarinimicrobiota bacterium]|nr:MAG: hypothetical protein Ct9H90mP7_4660 [Candidatus Neomarinimicrobiota bacterium]
MGNKQQIIAAKDLFLPNTIFFELGFECKVSWYFDLDRICFSINKRAKMKIINTADN